MATEIQVTFDCHDPVALSQFWATALGYRVQPPPPGFDSWPDALRALNVAESEWNARSACIDPDGKGPRLFFQRVPEDKTVKNRLHLDLRVAPGLEGEERMSALEARRGELESSGAALVRRVDPGSSPMETGFIVMTDPEGNEFCLD